MLPTEVRARKDLRHRLQSRGGRRRGSARLGGSLGLPRLLASVPQAEWRGFSHNAGRLGNPRSGVMRRAKEWSGVGVFLRSRLPCPGMVTGLQVDKKGGRVENAAGAGTTALRVPQSPQGS